MKKEKEKQEQLLNEQNTKECYDIVDNILEENLKELEDGGFLYEAYDNDESYDDDVPEKVDYNAIKDSIYKTTGKNITDAEIDRILNIDKDRKNMEIDPYMQNIIRILNQSKVVRRSSDKPMMTPKAQVAIKKASSEAHLTNRGMHQEQVGDLSAEIAENLGLNVRLARAGGKHHDDGHTNSGHTGERIASMIGKLSNCGYIVHNALSADMLISEGVIEKIIENIDKKGNEISEEKKEVIKKELWSLFDILISHNGEGKERIIRYNPDKTCEDIINDKNKCYTIEGYDKKIIPGTKEAAVVAFSDRICYVRTDILDGTTLEILKEFNDDYLKYIGILASKYNDNNELYKLADRIFTKEEKLEENMKSFLKETDIKEDNPIKIKQQIKKLLEDKSMTEEEFKDKVNQYLKIKEMKSDLLKATLNYGKIFVSGIPIEKRAETVADMIKDVTVEDLKEYSKGKDYIGVSPAIATAFFGIRTENLNQIVKFTRRKYERELLPQAEMKVQDDLKEALLSTGIIREYLISASEQTFELKEEEKASRNKFGLSKDIDFKNTVNKKKGRRYQAVSTKLKEKSNIRGKYKFERKVCHRFMKLYKYNPDRLREIYQNALDAVEDITKHDVQFAIGEEKIDKNDILAKEYEEKIEPIRAEIKERYSHNFSEDDKKTFIRELSNRRRNNRENLLASAVALEYTAGMADGTLLEASKIKKYLKRGQIKKGYERGAEPESTLSKMGKDWKGEDEIREDFLRKYMQSNVLERGEK